MWNTGAWVPRATCSINRWLQPCIQKPGPGADGLLARLECDQAFTMSIASFVLLSAASRSASDTFIGQAVATSAMRRTRSP